MGLTSGGSTKPDGDIRVCVDMRRANEAIERERHPIPTIEEVLHDLNGSTVFSKLDLKWGFHQVELETEWRRIYHIHYTPRSFSIQEVNVRNYLSS